MQAYFDCLVRKVNLSISENQDLQKILTTINSLHSNKYLEIYYQINALYEVYLNKNKNKALAILRDGIKNFNTSIYLTKELFDINEKYHDLDGMKEALELLS